jgi:hypothetical protein
MILLLNPTANHLTYTCCGRDVSTQLQVVRGNKEEKQENKPARNTRSVAVVHLRLLRATDRLEASFRPFR